MQKFTFYVVRLTTKGSLTLNGTKDFFVVDFNKKSSAYLVYHSDTEKVQKYRTVKFEYKSSVERQTQTDEVKPKYGQDSNGVYI